MTEEQQHFEIIRPLVTREQAVKLCQELYNFNAVTCKELVSYDDRNFLVTGNFIGNTSDSVETAQEPHSFVLKIANSLESQGDILEQQCRLMQSLSEAGLKVQSVMKTVSGTIVDKKLLTTPADSSGRMVDRRHAVRMLTYLPGVPLGELPLTADMLESVAKEIGRVDWHLTRHFLTDPGANAAELNLWSLLSAPKLVDFVQYVHGEARQRMVREIVAQFNSVVVGAAGAKSEATAQFTKAFIHGDPNESNILVDGNPPVFSGLLDWQDSHRAYAVFDLALLIMYTSFVQAKTDPTVDPFRLVVPPLIRGYTSEFKLAACELRHLPLLVATRFAQSLTLGAYSYARDPGNDYLLTTACSWSTLDRLWNGHKNRLEQLGCEWLEMSRAPE
ncbi:hypothetical protein BOX15_Mlig030284g1 [Macrostomum lignano]|uniref:Hydroxylysine kinase n=2 Tax=Macrostomum lignano TaxID=282301 RepID=A0A1I8G5P4_9PLAT|nr:hypothetical protein BOX15_Mlig030284g1 [Macrostomum lignano]